MKQKKSVATIIIPCYNCEKYLGRCLDSAVGQEHVENGQVEVIVVDDGSTDHSLDIARSYEKHVPFLRVIKQENQGVSAARNAGLDAAQGQYVLFLDADDWLEKDAVSFLLQAEEETGAQIIHYLRQCERLGQVAVAENGIQSKTLMDKEMIRVQAIPMMLGGTQLNSCFLNLYRLDFLRKNEIRFEKGRRMAEDALFVWQAIHKAETMYFVSRPLYHYFYHTSSTVRNITKKHVEDALEYQRHLQDSLAKDGLDTPQNRKLARQGMIVTGLDLIPKVAEKQLALELLGDQSIWRAWEEDGYRPKGALACVIAQNACEGKMKNAYLALKLYRWKRQWIRIWGKDVFLRVRNAFFHHISDVKRSISKKFVQDPSN